MNSSVCTEISLISRFQCVQRSVNKLCTLRKSDCSFSIALRNDYELSSLNTFSCLSAKISERQLGEKRRFRCLLSRRQCALARSCSRVHDLWPCSRLHFSYLGGVFACCAQASVDRMRKWSFCADEIPLNFLRKSVASC